VDLVDWRVDLNFNFETLTKVKIEYEMGSPFYNVDSSINLHVRTTQLETRAILATSKELDNANLPYFVVKTNGNIMTSARSQWRL
jgi:hypothetical protein